jgi:hypothetical protein
MNYFPVFLALCFLAACQPPDPKSAPNSHEHKSTEADLPGWTPPPAGTIVAGDSMAIKDPLNHFYFAVQLRSSAMNDQPGAAGFIYDVLAHFGPNAAEGQITMPEGGRNLRPLLRRAPDGGYSYRIGFITGSAFGRDTSFHDYYLVKGAKDNIEIKAVKAYSLK